MFGKPRLLIPMTIQFSVRYLLRTGLLQQIQQYAEPVVALGWDDPSLKAELADLGIECMPMPRSQWGVRYTRVRSQLSYWHLQHLASPSTAIDRRRYETGLNQKARLRRRARRALQAASLFVPGQRRKLIHQEEQLLQHDTNIAEAERLIDAVQPDAVFCLTPYLPDEELLLRVCAIRQIPMATAILSFDNITTRGWIPVLFDWYMLWNHYNVAELRRAYPETTASQVVMVGAPQFDFYWDASYIWPESLWRERLALPPERPVILFGAGYHAIVPHEPHWLAQLDHAIESGAIEGRPIILFRRHPLDPIERWEPIVRAARNVVYDDPWATGSEASRTNISRFDIEKLASTLRYCQVHINASSTMTIDGAIFDRPQIGPAYDDRPGKLYDRAMSELYEREHYIPITRSGGLEVVRCLDEMVQAINLALKDQQRLGQQRKQLVRDLCTYDDGCSASRVSQAVQRFLDSCVAKHHDVHYFSN